MFKKSKNNKLIHIHGIWLIVLYTVSLLVFSYLILHYWTEEESMDGLWYLLAPVISQFCCVVAFAIFSLIYYLIRMLRMHQK